MKLKIELKVSANEIFEQLLNLTLEDIKKGTGKNITIDKVQKNFFYEKCLTNKMGNEIPVKVIINELVKPSRYGVSIESTNGINTVNYELRDVTEGVEIIYEENFKSSSILLNCNYFIMSLIYARKSKKRMRNQLCSLEQLVLDSKNNQLNEGAR